MVIVLTLSIIKVLRMMHGLVATGLRTEDDFLPNETQDTDLTTSKLKGAHKKAAGLTELAAMSDSAKEWLHDFRESSEALRS